MNFGIIAAGDGSRLASEGISLPKPLVQIDGQPMIGRLIRIFDSLGAGRISVITNARMPEVAEYLRELAPQLRSSLDIVVKSTPSSMHSFYELGNLLRGHGRFVLTTVDTVFRPENFARYVEAFASAPAEVDGMMALTRHIDDEKPLYVETDPEMRIKAFLDAAPEHPEFISGGIYGLNDRAIDVLEQCIDSGVSRMRNYQRALLAAGLDIRAYDMGKIFDIDHASDLEKVRKEELKIEN